MPSEARHPRDGAASSPEGEQGPRSTGPRIVHAWSVLDRDRRLAAGAALALFATMLLPWYQQNAVVSAAKSEPLVSRNLNAFAVFSFVEAAVLLVAIAVLVLLFVRAEGRSFQLPGGDGAVIFAAGIWTALLLVLRLFDKPGIAQHGVAANVGIQWGIFFALAAAGVLAYAGSRIRAGARPEPPVVRHRPRGERRESTAPRAAATRREPAMPRDELPRTLLPDEDATVALPAPTPPASAAPAAARERPADTAPDVARERPRYPPSPSLSEPDQRTPIPARAEQLSFDDSPDSE
ncbi:MAG TPA: hypothetical protein VK756_02710 [Solirubrobacteraceae bacterium]|nr:hypothetical protein [Solirubrobacteraceae bacterium]